MLPFHRQGALSTEATIPQPCQVRSKAQCPCPNRAVVELRGVAFCGPCASEQEAYFAIGELVAREGARHPRGEPIVEALKRMRLERGGGRGGTAAEMHRGLSGVH